MCFIEIKREDERERKTCSKGLWAEVGVFYHNIMYVSIKCIFKTPFTRLSGKLTGNKMNQASTLAQ